MLISTDDHRPVAHPRILWRLGVVSLAAVGLLVACGDDGGTPTTIAPGGPATTVTVAPTTVADADGY